MSLLRPSGGHRAPGTRPTPGGAARTAGGHCHGPATRHSLSPALESPAVSWSLPLALPSQDRGHGTGLLPRAPPLRVDVVAGPRSAPAPLGMALPSLSLVTRVLGRVPGARRVRRSPGDWGGCPGKESRGQAWAPPPRRPNLPQAPGRAVRGQPRPREPPGGTWGPGAHKYRQGQSPPLLLRSESCSGGDPPPRGVAMGAGVEK